MDANEDPPFHLPTPPPARLARPNLMNPGFQGFSLFFSVDLASYDYIHQDCYLYTVNVYIYVVPQNIHTPPTEGFCFAPPSPQEIPV